MPGFVTQPIDFITKAIFSNSDTTKKFLTVLANQFRYFANECNASSPAKTEAQRSSLVSLLPRHLQYDLRYKSAHKELCLFQPKTFNQKLFYKMIYDRHPLLTTFVDKLAAR
jgi:hypothetical protein